jgi:cytochrome b involved in lipid metabolism
MSTRKRKPWTITQRLAAIPLRRAFLYQDTPQDRIERAVHRELADLSRRAALALEGMNGDDTSARAAAAARETLTHAEAAGSFPRHELTQIQTTLRAERPGAAGGSLDRAIGHWIDKHQQFERRLRWLLNPEVTRIELNKLDPMKDADQLFAFVKYEYRFEFLFCAWANAIERISQSESVATFFHGTGAAEGNPLKRTEDTLIHIYYFINWGADSYHGRLAADSMNQMHGRYFIHNDGMKYVLLNGIFSVLDSLKRVGHRPITQTELLGYFHSHIVMGKAMRIEQLSHDWDEMYDWFGTMNRAMSNHTPQKIRMWLSLEDNFDRDARVPAVVSRFRRKFEVIAMDDTYRTALGFEMPDDKTVARVKRIVDRVTRFRGLMPKGEPYIESLQNFMTYPNGVDIQESGVKARSPRMPRACPFHFTSAPIDPEYQLPLMDVSQAPQLEMKEFSWEEVRQHNKEDDLWVVFNGEVYDVSSFAKNHPGGLKVLLGGNGRDMTKAFVKANHTHLTKVFALNFRIGRIEPGPPPPVVRPERAVQANATAH